jgi:predicted ferric reductase
MEMTRHRLWRWTRSTFALLLSVALGAGSIAHTGFRVGHASIVFAYMLFALGSIYISIWKQWDFEIVGWALLAVFIVGMGMS